VSTDSFSFWAAVASAPCCDYEGNGKSCGDQVSLFLPISLSLPLSLAFPISLSLSLRGLRQVLRGPGSSIVERVGLSRPGVDVPEKEFER
jgi:hypothetical protein